MKNLNILKQITTDILVVSILLGVVGCKSLNFGDNSTAEPSDSSTIITPTSLSSSTQTPSVTQSSGYGSSPIPSQIIVPTLSATEAKKELLELLSNNSCEFPCFWGVIPGKTNLNEAVKLTRFNIFANGGGIFSEQGGRIFLRVPQVNNLLLNVAIEIDAVNGIVDSMSFETQMVRKIENGYEVQWGDPLYAELTRGYSLSNILSKYGEPSAVYIFTTRTVPVGSPWNFRIILFYPKDGFVVDYESSVINVSNGYILGCPTGAFSYFWFWPLSKDVSSDDVTTRFRLHEAKSIDVATNMSVETFYKVFRNQNDKCIETLQEMWPLP